MLRKIARLMRPERSPQEPFQTPPEWHPPAREIGGVNIPELFSYYLANEMISMICQSTGNFELPIAQEMEDLLRVQHELDGKLKTDGNFFHDKNTPVFMDYKRMRNKVFQEIARSMNVQGTPYEMSVAGYMAMRATFFPDMTTKQAIDHARKIVAGWDWELR